MNHVDRISELVYALEMQQECMRDLKRNIDTKQSIVELQATIIDRLEHIIKKQRVELNMVKIELNHEWN